MLLQDISVGDLVKFYLDKTDSLCRPSKSVKTIDSICILDMKNFKRDANTEDSIVVYVPNTTTKWGYNSKEFLENTQDRPIDSAIVSEYCVKNNINIDSRIGYIFHEFAIASVEKPSVKIINAPIGMFCIRCTEYSKWAESNLPDNKFMCFSCRDSNSWLFDSIASG